MVKILKFKAVNLLDGTSGTFGERKVTQVAEGRC